jgi:hypothetical protein
VAGLEGKIWIAGKLAQAESSREPTSSRIMFRLKPAAISLHCEVRLLDVILTLVKVVSCGEIITGRGKQDNSTKAKRVIKGICPI